MRKNTASQLNGEKEGRLFNTILLLRKDYYRGKFITGIPACQLIEILSIAAINEIKGCKNSIRIPFLIQFSITSMCSFAWISKPQEVR
jgi:hypothetical protein